MDKLRLAAACSWTRRKPTGFSMYFIPIIAFLQNLNIKRMPNILFFHLWILPFPTKHSIFQSIEIERELYISTGLRVREWAVSIM